jgi:hypothetical protein
MSLLSGSDPMRKSTHKRGSPCPKPVLMVTRNPSDC